MKTSYRLLTAIFFSLVMASVNAGDLTIPNTFSAGTPAVADEVNANFSEVEAEVDDNDQRITGLGTDLDALDASVTSLSVSVDDHEQRISALENTSSTNVINVAVTGGDFTSVADALNSISDAAADNQYLVRVAPGVYSETELVQVQSFVHLQGSGAGITTITSSRTSNAPSPDAATVQLDDAALISDVTVQNLGAASISIALYSAETTRATVVNNVNAEAIGAGGIGHFAAYWNDAEAKILNSQLLASGAVGFGTAVNTAFGSVNIAAGFPQAIIENTNLIGGGANSLVNCVDPTGTGFGMQLSNSSPTVRNSYICGGHRGISVAVNGNATVQGTDVRVSTTGSAFLFEITASGSISVSNSGVAYLGNKFTGAGTGLRCVHNYNFGTLAPVTNGNTAATACN